MKTNSQINTLEELAEWIKNYNTEIEELYYKSCRKGIHYNIVKRKRYLKQTVENFVIKYSHENGVPKDDVHIELFKIKAGIRI